MRDRQGPFKTKMNFQSLICVICFYHLAHFRGSAGQRSSNDDPSSSSSSPLPSSLTNSHSATLSSGDMAAIVICSVVGVFLVAALVWWIIKKFKAASCWSVDIEKALGKELTPSSHYPAQLGPQDGLELSNQVPRGYTAPRIQVPCSSAVADGGRIADPTLTGRPVSPGKASMLMKWLESVEGAVDVMATADTISQEGRGSGQLLSRGVTSSASVVSASAGGPKDAPTGKGSRSGGGLAAWLPLAAQQLLDKSGVSKKRKEPQGITFHRLPPSQAGSPAPSTIGGSTRMLLHNVKLRSDDHYDMMGSTDLLGMEVPLPAATEEHMMMWEQQQQQQQQQQHVPVGGKATSASQLRGRSARVIGEVVGGHELSAAAAGSTAVISSDLLDVQRMTSLSRMSLGSRSGGISFTQLSSRPLAGVIRSLQQPDDNSSTPLGASSTAGQMMISQHTMVASNLIHQSVPNTGTNGGSNPPKSVLGRTSLKSSSSRLSTSTYSPPASQGHLHPSPPLNHVTTQEAGRPSNIIAGGGAYNEFQEVSGLLSPVAEEGTLTPTTPSVLFSPSTTSNPATARIRTATAPILTSLPSPLPVTASTSPLTSSSPNEQEPVAAQRLQPSPAVFAGHPSQEDSLLNNPGNIILPNPFMMNNHNTAVHKYSLASPPLQTPSPNNSAALTQLTCSVTDLTKSQISPASDTAILSSLPAVKHSLLLPGGVDPNSSVKCSSDCSSSSTSSPLRAARLGPFASPLPSLELPAASGVLTTPSKSRWASGGGSAPSAADSVHPTQANTIAAVNMIASTGEVIVPATTTASKSQLCLSYSTNKHMKQLDEKQGVRLNSIEQPAFTHAAVVCDEHQVITRIGLHQSVENAQLRDNGHGQVHRSTAPTAVHLSQSKEVGGKEGELAGDTTTTGSDILFMTADSRSMTTGDLSPLSPSLFTHALPSEVVLRMMKDHKQETS
ncbi:hypothetical protein CEUSTIGMA_g10726.t1 [Chlamydomonas eustigma]|uniref:Uncharacterized protein n=1 Tax=Chlamydomonas eustigma TaxID=1157962 RepID=A0A250XKG6_9CHLO|nr:hypothetical protein CEUSTIGMA_g10726.t1 [Chlamydomonas eustigma]|eukprot:GAX83300.1 hypothetical protein CEUSTIGMA_g10726.t1 [Chlamydomonas eustigma]